ncbi:MAG: hypothetical protein KA152_06880 [Verrucomicrobiales bacterium]|nr:hypothetical protein [Verrucomicrobiales bacterium]
MKIQFIDCPHCNEAALYHRAFGENKVLTCRHCNSVFTDKEAAEIESEQFTDSAITAGYRACSVISFIVIVGTGLLVMWLVLNRL